MIREAEHKDLQAILELYLHLHEKEVPEESENIFSLSESEMEGLLTEIIDAIYAKVLGE